MYKKLARYAGTPASDRTESTSKLYHGFMVIGTVLFKKISLGAHTLLENLPDPRVGNLIFGFSANCSFALFKRAMRGIRSRHLLKKSNSLSFVFIRAKPKVKSDKSDSHVVL